MGTRAFSKPPLWTRALAITLALLPFVTLWLQSTKKTLDLAPKSVLLVPIIERRAEAERTSPPPKLSAPTLASPSRRVRPSIDKNALSTRTLEPQPEQGPSLSALETTPHVTSSAASAPLDLSPSVVSSAVRASKSEVRKLAEASGAYVEDEQTPKSEGLAGAVANAAHPDCLAPNENGSLLSALVIAYMATKGKCK